jgi:uncharacterized protein YndB with AHSA1/START domain
MIAKHPFSEGSGTEASSDRELLITRVINAPRDLVYEVWTKPEHIVNWWGPKGFTNTILEMDVRPGGVWSLIMHGPDGTDYPNRIEFIEVVKPELLVWIHGSGEKNDPGEFTSSVRFEEEGNATRLTMRMVFTSAEELEKVVREYGAIEGNKQTMDKLEAYLRTL